MADDQVQTQEQQDAQKLFQRVHAKLRQGATMEQIETALHNRGYEGMKGLVEKLSGADHSQDPKAWQSFAGALLDSASFGLGKRIGGLAEGAGAAARGGSFKDAYTNYLREYESGLSDLHTANKKSAIAGDIIGGVGSALAMPAGELAQGAGWAARIGRAAKLGATISGISALGHAKDLTDPKDLAEAGIETAVGAAGGALTEGAVGALSAARTSIFNPAYARLTKALGIVGNKAEKALADAHPNLPPLGIELAKRMRQVAAKAIRANPDAGVEAGANIDQELARVTQAKQAITEHPQTGYDALLQGKQIQDPEALQIMKTFGGSTSTAARDVFELQKDLTNAARSASAARRLGMASPGRIRTGVASGEAAQSLREILGNEIPGFNQLQANAAPYIQREQQLARLSKQIKTMTESLRSSAGGEEPKTLWHVLTEHAGAFPEKAKANAAADILPILSKPVRSMSELHGRIEGLLPRLLQPTTGPQAVVGGLAGQGTQGLLDLLAQQQQQQP